MLYQMNIAKHASASKIHFPYIYYRKKRKIRKHGLMQNLKRRLQQNLNSIYEMYISWNKSALGKYIELLGE